VLPSGSLGWTWVGAPVLFGCCVPAIVHVSRVWLLRRCRAWWCRRWSSLRDLSTKCGSMLSPVTFFAGGMGGWLSSSPRCLRLSAPHVTSVAMVPVFRRLRVLLDALAVGSGDVGELLPPPGSGGRSWPPSCRSFSSSTPRVACCLLVDCLLLCSGGGLREVGSGGLRKFGPLSSDRQWVRLSERTSPRWRRCLGLRPFVLPGVNLVCFGVGRRMMAASTSFPSLEASPCMSFMLFFRWRLGAGLSVMCLRSCCTPFVQV
jgi:hypothetical protein